MTDRYTKNYRILGIRPGTNWKELRRVYKSLVNTWHPDRFQQNAHEKKIAEEKTKEITQSYKELAEYYKAFGVLPIETETTESVTDEQTAPPNETAEPIKTGGQGSKYTDPTTAAQTPKHRYTPRITRIISGAALIGAAYFAWQLVPEKHPEYSPTDEIQSNEVTSVQEHYGSEPLTTPTEKYFMVGTSLGEVYAIQGVPSKTEKDIWYYGNSKVYFVKGRVVRWEESADNPLRAQFMADDDKPTRAFFSKGSSKEEVLAIQGAPDRNVGNVWDYGVSRVYFDKERVSGWHDSPLNPLRVRH